MTITSLQFAVWRNNADKWMVYLTANIDGTHPMPVSQQFDTRLEACTARDSMRVTMDLHQGAIIVEVRP